jgi:SAM-dependent methyltransferase
VPRLRHRLASALWSLRSSSSDLARRGSTALQRRGPLHVLLRHQYHFARRNPVSVTKWDSQYADDVYAQRLDAARQIPHHMVILGYLTYGVEWPRILEIGCGHGRLLKLLSKFDFSEYVGVDWSDHAVERARLLSVPSARLEVGDMDHWDTRERFDVIVLDECLYYSVDPCALFERTLGWLSSDGVVIVSMFRSFGSRYIWSRVESLAVEEVAGCAVKDAVQQGVWDVKMLRFRRTLGTSLPQN